MPPKADLGDLRGLASGLDGRISAMINGGEFDGAKAYKDSKVCCTRPCLISLILSVYEGDIKLPDYYSPKKLKEMLIILCSLLMQEQSYKEIFL